MLGSGAPCQVSLARCTKATRWTFRSIDRKGRSCSANCPTFLSAISPVNSWVIIQQFLLHFCSRFMFDSMPLFTASKGPSRTMASKILLSPEHMAWWDRHGTAECKIGAARTTASRCRQYCSSTFTPYHFKATGFVLLASYQPSKPSLFRLLAYRSGKQLCDKVLDYCQITLTYDFDAQPSDYFKLIC